MRRVSPRIVVAMGIGLAVGLLWSVAVRTALVKNTAPHYHANFAVYVDGQRLKFEGPSFYEEVASCSTDTFEDPKGRTHMHGNVDHVIHVHDYAVTWADFFANLRYSLGDRVLQLDDKVLVDGLDGKKLSFWLNGHPVDKVANTVIEDQDILLISYGSDDQTDLQREYQAIPKDAARYDEGTDPSSCRGTEKLTLSERLKRAIQVNPSTD